ncbi:EAL and GGDEF domain-containing protein [Cytobacillus luteolus]|nr:EAL domain-containing protein [Cytobacillus luteolus]MBP1941790.1 diguanylate cyclase (GGDEF)-like protein/PAS domain S-box-containing protein [Cytobacillus luteolus]
MEKRKGTIGRNLKSIMNNEKMENDIFQIILKYIEDLIYIMKVDNNNTFRYLYANENALKQAMLIPEYIGKTFHEILPEHIAVHLQDKYEGVIKSRSVFSFQDRVTLPSGQEVYSESILTPIFDEENVIRYVVSITRDITNRVNENKKLIESTERYKSLVDHNMDAVMSLDLKGNILHANPSTENIIGKYEEPLIDRSIFNLIDDSDVDNFRNIFQETLNGKPSELMECKIKHKDNRNISVHVKTVPIIVSEEVSGIFAIIKDITEQINYHQMMKHMAYFDQLTGLPNRSSLKEDLTNIVSKANEIKQHFAIMYLDLDRFKFLNDTLGHNVGDEVLIQVAHRLKSIDVRGYTIYRQGGDEFIVLLENTTVEKSSLLADMILDVFKMPFTFSQQEYFMTTSIGISCFPNDGIDGETLIKNADTALYQVKERGKGHYQYYRKDMKKGTSQTMLLETGLRKSIERDELVLLYQPQIDLLTGETTSFEALIRWNHPELGFISPGEFIPLAEETGLIIPIGEWVIEKVCKKLRDWKEAGYSDISIAVNLSPRQFQQPGLVNYIERNILTNKIDSNNLEFEITEGAIQDSKEALHTLAELKKLGVKVAVDDFGTGYSSLSYLKYFPIDTLKIDQSFVREVLQDKKDMAITTTIIHLAQSLGLSVVAEGVEDEKQAIFFKKMKCDKAQGYFFSRPINEETVEAHYFKK